MFKTTCTVTPVVVTLEVADWACSERNGRFSRLYQLTIARSSTDQGWENVRSFRIDLRLEEATWSEALRAIRGYRLRARLDGVSLCFLSCIGGYCERIGREVNAILPSHDLPTWSNGK